MPADKFVETPTLSTRALLSPPARLGATGELGATTQPAVPATEPAQSSTVPTAAPTGPATAPAVTTTPAFVFEGGGGEGGDAGDGGSGGGDGGGDGGL